jgi:hypothetical protein
LESLASSELDEVPAPSEYETASRCVIDRITLTRLQSPSCGILAEQERRIRHG